MATLRVGFSIAFACLLTVGAADAQTSPAPASGPAPESSPTPESSPAPAAEPEVSEAAQAEAANRFEEALQLSREGRNDLALVELRRAYELTHNYRVLYNIGVVLDRLGRYSDSVAAYEQYLQDGGANISAERHAEVEETLSVIRKRTAKLHIVLASGLSGVEVQVAGKIVPADRLADVRVDAGSNEIVATKSGFDTFRRSIVLAGGDEATVDVDLKKSETLIVDRRSSPYPWIGWGVTGALAVGTAALGLAWKGAQGDLDDAKGTFPYTPATDLRSLANKTDTFQTLTFVAGGLTLASAGAALYFTLRKEGGDKDRVGSVDIYPTLGGVGLNTRF